MNDTLTTAVVMAVAWIGLQAGHQVADHAVQTQAQASGKAAPAVDELRAGVSPWAGWGACARHVATYLVTQAIALALVARVAPLTLSGAVAALAWSGATHAVIDRRWLVRWLLERKGATGWTDGPYLVDQSLHHAALFFAAVMAATRTTAGDAVTGVLLSAVQVVVCLLAEYAWGRPARLVDGGERS